MLSFVSARVGMARGSRYHSADKYTVKAVLPLQLLQDTTSIIEGNLAYLIGRSLSY